MTPIHVIVLYNEQAMILALEFTLKTTMPYHYAHQYSITNKHCHSDICDFFVTDAAQFQ